MPAVVVGRDAELASTRAFVAGISDGASAVVLEGEAGMGKTTLWRAAVERAESSGVLVLQAQPVESEMTLSFAGLGDLLDPVLETGLRSLPPVQERALTRALALGVEDEVDLDPRTLRVAVMSLLRGLAEERPVLVAIDDSQWLDYASSAALAYGARRFRAERIGLLLSRRSGLESVLLNELLRSPAGELFTTVHVSPLDSVELGRVVREHFGTLLPRPLLAEVHEASGGNPFYALEIVRTLASSDAAVEAGKPLPVPDSLHDLVHGRLLALPRESRDFLAAAAAHARPTIGITEDASGVGRAVGLSPALEARIVDTHGDEIRFTHPLLAAGALETADPRRRAEIHARLAELLEDPEARAWQLAASVDDPAEDVAQVLEDAAKHARARGALRPAALLLDRAQRLTPAEHPAEAVRRAVDAAYLHFEAGDSRRAESQLRHLVAPLPAGPVRARALVVLARTRLYEAPDEARALFTQVIEEAGDDLRTLTLAHEGVAACGVWMFEQWDDVLRHTGIALTLAAELDDEALAADVILARLGAETLLGRDTAPATAERALALQRSAEDLRVMDQPLISLCECWGWTDEFDKSRLAALELLRRAEDHGDENARPWLLFLLGEAERLLGSLETAGERARAGRDAATQSGQPLLGGHNLALESLVHAQLGNPEATRQAASQARLAGSSNFVRLHTAEALGHLALAAGAHSETVAELEPCLTFVREEGIVEPGAARFVPDHVTALIELGRVDEAAELLDWYEGNARRLGRASAIANCLRCRALLAAQAGALESAVDAFQEALEWHARVELPLDRGRTLLALGAAQRRLKRRREARATLEEAVATFERIGAGLWAERARGELKRISGRAATPGALTPAEERVASLVAEGKTNRQVAAALFLSERTVEGHLSRVFAKLGIRHRSEIASALPPAQTPGAPSSNTGGSPVSAESSAP